VSNDGVVVAVLVDVAEGDASVGGHIWQAVSTFPIGVACERWRRRPAVLVHLIAIDDNIQQRVSTELPGGGPAQNIKPTCGC
jgi:hypothetical protein